MKKTIYILIIIFNLVISSAIFAQEKEDILTQQEFIDIVIKYHPIAKQADINIEKAKANREWAKYFFENGEGNKMTGVSGSLWAAYNGVTELVDHKITKQSQDRKLNTIWFGDGAVVKSKAYKAAVDLV